MRKQITITLYDRNKGRNRPPDDVVELIEWFQKHLESVPPEFRERAVYDQYADSNGDIETQLYYTPPLE